jgi:2'-5' RNA ligase
MNELIALDVAVLPPPDVTAKAVALSAALPEGESQGLRLDHDHLPHVTLMQLFARVNELDQVFSRVDDTVRGVVPLALRATGGGGTNTIWIAIDKTPPLVDLHERLMEALRGLERPDGGTSAFFGDEARLRDVLWVTGYRLKSSFHHFEPHITLGHGSAGHGSAPPDVEPFTFDANTVAVCHLGRHCTCRRVLRQWTLTGAGA